MIRKYSCNNCGNTGSNVSSAPSASIKNRNALDASICTGNAGSLNRCSTICNKVRKCVPSSENLALEYCWTIQQARYRMNAMGELNDGNTDVNNNPSISLEYLSFAKRNLANDPNVNNAPSNST